MGTSAGQVVTPFSLTGGGSAPVSTPFSFNTNTAGTASAMSALNNSTSGLNTNFSLAPLQGYQNPGYQNLGQNIPWNLTGSDFGNPNATTASANSSGGLGGAASAVGNFFSNIYDHLKGGMEGLAAGYAGYQAPSWEQTQPESQDTTGQAFQREADMSGLGGILNAVKSGWNGLVNDPQQAQQDYQQSVIKPFDSMPAVPRIANQFLANTATDPLTYVPVGTIAKVTGITPMLKYGYDFAKGAVKGADSAGGIADAIKSAPENPFASELQDITSQKADVQAQHDELAKSLLSEMNASKDQGILSELQNAGVRRPLQDDAFYNEYKMLPPSVQRLFQPGNVSKGALSLDEFAAQKGTDVASLLDSLNGAKKTYSMADVLGSPALEDHQQALNMLDELYNETKSAHDAWTPAEEEVAATGDAGAQAVKGNPYAAYNWQSKIGAPIAKLLADAAPNGIPGLRQLFTGTENALGKAFVKYYGVSQPIVDALKNAMGQRASDQFYIQKTLTDLAKSHGLTSEEMQQIPHLFEGTIAPEQVSGKVVQAYNDLKNVLENGIQLPSGERILGTQHELNTSLNGRQLLDPTTLRPNYFPHIYNNSNKELNAAFQKAGTKGISVTGPHNQERTFDTIKQAQAAGLKPELNPYKAIGQRLGNSSKAIRNAQLLDSLINSGSLVKGDAVDSIIKNVKTGQSSLEDAINNAYHDTGAKAVPGMVQSKIPQLRNYFMLPADEAALRDFVEPNSPNGFVTGLNKLTNWYKRFALMNPMVHFHNIETNGRYLGNANAQYAKQARNAIKNNVPDEWYMKAMRDGAISQDSGRGFVDNLGKSIDKATAPSTPWNTVKNTYNAVTHDALWNEDKALRVALYRQGYEEAAAKGASDAEAGQAGAALANKYMVNYNNLTPFEKTYVQHLFGFYPWTKGNTALQADQWVNNTGKMLAYERAKDAISQGISGQPTDSKGRIDSGQVLADGNHVYVDPYSPIDELPKVGADGIGPYLFSKLNPYLKTAINMGTNHTINPWDNSPVWKNGAPDSANLQNVAGDLLNNVNPFGGGITGNAIKDEVKGKPPMTPLEGITQALGGFTSRSNPLLQSYYNQKDAQTQLQGQIKYDKANGIPVSKQQTKDAYKKIPYPVVTSPLGN